MQENKIKIIIIILIILMILTAVGGTILYITTDMFKSSETLFQKYILQDIQNIAEVIDISKEEQNIDKLRKSDYKESTKATLKYLENENDEEEIYDITETGIIKSSEETSYRNISANYGDTELISVDLLKQNNTYGLRLANLVKQFVSVENATLSYFVSSMGYDGKYFSEKLNGVDISGLLDFTNEEIEQLSTTYANIIFSDINKKNYSSNSNIITLSNKDSVTTNSYTLTLTKNDIDKIYKRVLNQAINDQILLGKIEKIDAKIKEAGFVEPEGKSLKELYISALQEKVNEIEYQGEDTRKISFTVYVSKGITVRTVIKTETSEFTLDLDNKKGKTLNLKVVKLTDQGNEIKTYSVGKENSEQGRTRTITYDDDIQSFDININILEQESKIGITTDLNYNSDKITKLNFQSNTDITLSANEAIPVNFDENNNILLNNYEGEVITSILDNLKNRTIKSLENSQTTINTKLLNNILRFIDEMEKQRQDEIRNNIELQKQRFNNQFILYEGEQVEAQYIQKLIKAASKNMSDYQVISGKQIRLFIENGKENEAKANEIANVISDRYKYNVTINYSQEGYVESVDISVYQKPK